MQKRNNQKPRRTKPANEFYIGSRSSAYDLAVVIDRRFKKGDFAEAKLFGKGNAILVVNKLLATATRIGVPFTIKKYKFELQQMEDDLVPSVEAIMQCNLAAKKATVKK